MTKLRNATLFGLVVCLVLIAPVACHKAPPPTVTPTPQAPPPPPPVTTVAPTTDFVKPAVEPTATSETLPRDLDALNAQAQSRGWIQDAFFAFDDSTLTSESQTALTASATWLKAHADYNLLIEGHCDERGTEQYNLALGDRRANTAREYLGTLGVDPARMRTVSYGVERPFDPGHNEEAWAKNRRAHLVLVGK
jgi:peptidoglycan-associated lipoprotein